MTAELDEWQKRAELGEPSAMIALAWEFYIGENLERNVDRAVALLKKAELKAPFLARFYLAKINLLEGRSESYDSLVADCNAGFAPACYLTAVSIERGLASGSETHDNLYYYALGARKGHLVSKYFLWKSAPKSTWQKIVELPYAAILIWQTARAKFRDPRSHEILM